MLLILVLVLVLVLQSNGSTLDRLPNDLLVYICLVCPWILPALSATNHAMHSVLSVRSAPLALHQLYMKTLLTPTEQMACKYYRILPYYSGNLAFDQVPLPESKDQVLCRITPRIEFDAFMNRAITDRSLQVEMLFNNQGHLSRYLESCKMSFIPERMALCIFQCLCIGDNYREQVKKLGELSPALTVLVLEDLLNNPDYDFNAHGVGSVPFFASMVAGSIILCNDQFCYKIHRLVKKHHMIGYLLGRGMIGEAVLSRAHREACLSTAWYKLTIEGVTDEDEPFLLEIHKNQWHPLIPMAMYEQILTRPSTFCPRATKCLQPIIAECPYSLVKALLIGTVPFAKFTRRRRHTIISTFSLHLILYRLFADASCREALLVYHNTARLEYGVIEKAYEVYKAEEYAVLRVVLETVKQMYSREWQSVLEHYCDTVIHDYLQWKLN